MKILHTSDLHLGAKTENRSRLVEQKQILAEIVEIAEKEQVDIVVIAGDIFHTATPSAEAEDLFYDFLEQLTRDDSRAVLVVSGNHDDPKRLAACLPLAKRHNIVLCTSLEPLPAYPLRGKVQITKTASGFVQLAKGDDRVCAALLPYATQCRLSQGGDTVATDLPYEEQVRTWANHVCKNFVPNTFHLLVTHLYFVGAQEERNGKPTRVKLGDSLAVPTTVLPACDYVAVGHLHSYQLVKGSKNVYYSGAPIRLRQYDEAPRVLVLDTNKVSSPKEILLKTPVKIVELSAKDFLEMLQVIEKQKATDLLMLTFTKATSLDASALRELKAAHSGILSIRFARPEISGTEKHQVRSLNPTELFVEFYKARQGEPPSDALIQTFLSLLEEHDET